MLCQRSGSCCITMPVVVPVWTDEGVRARFKPGGVPCPHLSYEGSTASCAVHDRPEYVGSPCWIYGNPDVDPDFASKRGRPCQVGKLIQEHGGVPLISPEHLSKRIREDELEDLGPWPSAEERIS